ncbi:MAG TPA: DUF885 domain-containing protein [Actinomycetota bacterium]|nr:DUF885 domain-containing protein [Actinomycetota bacterium]
MRVRYAPCRSTLTIPKGGITSGSRHQDGERSAQEAAARELADRFWEDLLILDPLIGTEIGDDRYDDRMPDPSEQGLARREEAHRRALEDLRAIDRAALSVDLRTTLDVLEAIARRELNDLALRVDRFQAVTHLFGPGNLLAVLGSLQRADTAERAEKYTARVATFPSYLEEVGKVAMEGAQLGQTQPAIVVDRAIAQVERLLHLPPESSPGIEPAKDASDADRERVVEVLRERVWPAYARYVQTLREYRRSARDSVGLLDLPNGDEIYAAQIKGFTTLSLDPREVHRIGLEQLEQIQEERQEIADHLGYSDAPTAIAERNASGKNTAVSREELVRLAEEQVQRSWNAAPAFFGRLPRANCMVKPVEEFREKDVPMAFYYPQSEDGSRPGIYYINAGDLPDRPLHLLAGVTYHEANPGHHFQISIDMEFSDRPRLRRFGGIGAGSAFAEGWGLYSERLADEMSLYQDDYERLGMLDAQGWRANRLIIDTGIHALGWERDRGVDQLIQAGPPRAGAEIEVDRYIAWPGQALAYKIGQIEIERWRAEAAERAGSSFSLMDFHDRLLTLGSLPLPTLERELRSGG